MIHAQYSKSPETIALCENSVVDVKANKWLEKTSNMIK